MKASRSRRASSSRPAPAPATPKAIFANRLRSLMDSHGLTVAETVRRANEHMPKGKSLSKASVSQYRSGRSVPRQPSLDALGAALGVRPSDLLGSSQKPAKAGPARRASAELRDRVIAKGRTGPSRADVVRAESSPQDRLAIEDCGEEVHIRFDQRVPWSVAVRIFEALKTRND
jgi:transcriptional regulator with XRE-family HTH domain